MSADIIASAIAKAGPDIVVASLAIAAATQVAAARGIVGALPAVLPPPERRSAEQGRAAATIGLLIERLAESARLLQTVVDGLVDHERRGGSP